MGEIRIVGPGKTHGYPYPVCKKNRYFEVSVFEITTVAEFANNLDPDEVAHNEPPHMDLHCLPSSL